MPMLPSGIPEPPLSDEISVLFNEAISGLPEMVPAIPVPAIPRSEAAFDPLRAATPKDPPPPVVSVRRIPLPSVRTAATTFPAVTLLIASSTCPIVLAVARLISNVEPSPA